MKRLLMCAALAASAWAGDDVPSWLREYSSAKAPAYSPHVPAVVLFSEQAVTVDESGRVVTSDRKAIRILTREGRKEAVAGQIYVMNTGKVRDLRAWLIRPSGEVKKYGKGEVLDIALAQNDVYNEVRERAVVASEDADPGAVFGYEAVSEDRSVFTQFEWSFQSRMPALLSRYTLTVPQGWRAEAVVFNGKVAPEQSGSSYTWECRNLPFIEPEPASPAMDSMVPRLAVSYFPAGSAKATQGKFFNGWPDVARWLAELEESQGAADGDLSAKAGGLVAGAKSEWERIRAIGSYVQAVRYVAIQTGIGRGGGYKPHLASEVFRKQYGDCKDKANLMRTMLRVAGIPAYIVSIYSGDPAYVREDWPSPQQFNHAIVAVKLSDFATQAPAVADHPKLGRLLFFDPTDEYTPPGDLPQHEQGSLALVDAADAGGLIRMPVMPASANRVERETEVALGPDGSIVSQVRERAYGQSAAAFRHVLRSQARADFTKSIEQWISSGANGATVGKMEPADAPADGRFDLQLEFRAARYAQLMQGRLLIFRPAVLLRRDRAVFTEAKRQNPVVLHGEAFQETVRVKLPAGFKIDEMPEGGHLDTPFGSFTCSYAAKGEDLTFARKLEIKAGVIPVEQYGALKAFFEQVAGAEQAPVVLVKE
ncbi:MAG: DUF3857 domain-containing protein [Bryobacteraceae bacterium]|jgi:transglutaminase-like putative cysteine protease